MIQLNLCTKKTFDVDETNIPLYIDLTIPNNKYINDDLDECSTISGSDFQYEQEGEGPEGGRGRGEKKRNEGKNGVIGVVATDTQAVTARRKNKQVSTTRTRNMKRPPLQSIQIVNTTSFGYQEEQQEQEPPPAPDIDSPRGVNHYDHVEAQSHHLSRANNKTRSERKRLFYEQNQSQHDQNQSQSLFNQMHGIDKEPKTLPPPSQIKMDQEQNQTQEDPPPIRISQLPITEISSSSFSCVLSHMTPTTTTTSTTIYNSHNTNILKIKSRLRQIESDYYTGRINSSLGW